MNKYLKLSLIATAIYSAFKLGQYEKNKKRILEHEKTIIKKGNFSKDIEILQKNINGIYGFEKLPITGAFCKKTKIELDNVFKDSEFYDQKSGSIKIESLRTINKVLNQLNNKISN